MRYVDLYLNSAAPEGQQCLLLNGSTMESTGSWVIMLGDYVTVRLWFQQSSATIAGSPATVPMLNPGDCIVMGAKLASNLQAADFVFGQTVWNTVTDANNITHYEGAVLFDSLALRAGITSASQIQIPLMVNVRIIDATDTYRQTWQFGASCYTGVISGAEGTVQATGSPAYPLPGVLLSAFGYNANHDLTPVSLVTATLLSGWDVTAAGDLTPDNGALPAGALFSLNANNDFQPN